MTCKRLTIFEGPDGGGKTSAAKAFANETRAHYVHFGPLPRVTSGLARMYVEAMMPALMGYQDVVFDRCWLSEVPYGNAFRNGLDRLGISSTRMLERLALRCSGAVVYCLPEWETVKGNYMSRKSIEYLENEEQLHNVFRGYLTQRTSLPAIEYDYTARKLPAVIESLDALRLPPHELNVRSAGNLRARVVLVGESFAERKNDDPWYQWPFASFNSTGCSQWLTHGLHLFQIQERELLWINADELKNLLHIPDFFLGRSVIALGTDAEKALREANVSHTAVAHPQAHKRFRAKEIYPLFPTLKEIL